MKDSFYTPTALADQLVHFVIKEDVRTVADFSVGEGELLKAALKRWPNLVCLGVDISEQVIEHVRAHNPNWQLVNCDFLSNESTILEAMKGSVDLILLNPPFSCLGGTSHKVELDGQEYNASTAMTFLVKSMKYLSEGGCIFAILPNSVAYSIKDQKLWNALEKKYKLNILEEPDKKYFNNCSPSIILVSVNAETPKIFRKMKPLSTVIPNLSVFRGKIRMHTVKHSDNGEMFIHSTNLVDNRIINHGIKIESEFSKITGPAVLLPRVGNPTKGKICIIGANEKYILSDCVLAIRTNTLDESKLIMSLLLREWNNVLNLYKGTGAKYITVDRLKEFIGITKSEFIVASEVLVS